jgi:hypothetical protein
MAMTIFVRQELDVTNKTRSNIFGCRRQFTTEFARQSAKVYAAL